MPREHLAVSGDIVHCLSWGWEECYWPLVVRDTVKHSSKWTELTLRACRAASTFPPLSPSLLQVGTIGDSPSDQQPNGQNLYFVLLVMYLV